MSATLSFLRGGTWGSVGVALNSVGGDRCPVGGVRVCGLAGVGVLNWKLGILLRA